MPAEIASMKKLLLAISSLFCTLFLLAQGTYIPLGGDSYRYVDRFDIKYGRILPMLHTTVKQYKRGEVARLAETMHFSNLKLNKVRQFQIQYLMDENGEWLDSVESKTKRPLFKKLYREPASFFHVSSKKKGLFDLRINPMIAVSVGAESKGGRFIFDRSVGLEFRGNIKRVLSFYLNVTGNSARPLSYVSDKYSRGTYRFIPGDAYFKTYSSKIFKFNDGIDFFDSRGYVNINILNYVNLQFGRDKHFIGNGMRSLILSDNAAPYLFLKLNISYWRFNYQSIFAELTSPYLRGADQLLPKKYMAVHHLNIRMARWLDVGIFESVIMKRSNHFELQYLNPIIFYRSVEHALGSPDNVLLGGDFKANIARRASLYGQFVLDEFNTKYFFKGSGWWANKFGLQLGLKYIDLAPNLDAQVEFNMVRPFTYTHPGEISYTHYNQALAHPLGANFYEFIVNLRYQPIPKLAMNLKFFTARVGDDTLNAEGKLTNYGGDIFRPSAGANTVGILTAGSNGELGNKIGQGAKGTINYFQLLTSYQPWHNIYFDAEILYRIKSSKLVLENQSTFYFGLGMRMNIAKRNYEF